MNEYMKLKKSNCQNCYKCIRRCPVKSISFSGDQAQIVGEECVLCGQCFVVCPQNAKEIRCDIDKAKALIESGVQVYASVAPSFVANYEGITIGSVEKALKALGFSGAEETALGATMVKKRYDDMVDEARQNVIVSSCCHTVNLLIQKHFPEVVSCVAQVTSPMMAHCQSVKQQHPQVKTVFVGPCISKKAEAEQYPGAEDCVLTFEELSQWMDERGVTFEAVPDDNAQSRARLFPTAGGILNTMEKRQNNRIWRIFANDWYNFLCVGFNIFCPSDFGTVGLVTNFVKDARCIFVISAYVIKERLRFFHMNKRIIIKHNVPVNNSIHVQRQRIIHCTDDILSNGSVCQISAFIRIHRNSKNIGPRLLCGADGFGASKLWIPLHTVAAHAAEHDFASTPV